MTITEELHINCPRSAAFDLMADVRKITRWNGGASRAEMTSEEPIGQGSQFITVNRGQELESTITTFDRPERLEFDVTGKLMSVLFPVLSPLIRRDLRKQHAKFKELCEKNEAAG